LDTSEGLFTKLSTVKSKTKLLQSTRPLTTIVFQHKMNDSEKFAGVKVSCNVFQRSVYGNSHHTRAKDQVLLIVISVKVFFCSFV